VSSREISEENQLDKLVGQIEGWAHEAGFQQVGISDVDMQNEQSRLRAWLDKRYHGSMRWMEKHADKRLQPELLHPGTLRIISLRMNYLPENTEPVKVLKSPEKAYVSRYALGRDYHKLIRKRLANIAKKIETEASAIYADLKISQRPFVDSAPVLERPAAHKAGLGWIGKHTLLINENAGSFFFLGEIFTNLPLPLNRKKPQNLCGDCRACLQICPTDAFPEPYVLDARRCISYLTIENPGPIPEEFRQVMGNRVFGCDDCQVICPWNKPANFTLEDDFQPRHGLESQELLELFRWDEATYLALTEGSAIRRIGYEGWLRNLAVGLGNAAPDEKIQQALREKRPNVSPLVAEHIDWALAQQQNPRRRRIRKLRREPIDRTRG